jgi:hypothetical protein
MDLRRVLHTILPDADAPWPRQLLDTYPTTRPHPLRLRESERASYSCIVMIVLFNLR